MYSDPQLVEPVHSLKESGRKFPNKSATVAIDNIIPDINERKEFLEEEILSTNKEEVKLNTASTPFDITSIANKITFEENAAISNKENTVFPSEIIDQIESEDSPIDTDEIIEFHK